MRGNFKSLARRIVETEEKEPVHINPEEYTLEDIIDFVIIYEMTKQSGNAEVFESAAEEEFEIIKRGPVFQYYREMLFPDERMAQSNNIMNGETNTQVRQNVVQPKAAPLRTEQLDVNIGEVSDLEELHGLNDQEFLKQLELRLSRVPQSTEIGYRWANNLKDKEENLDMVKNCIINGKFETIGSAPSNMVWEDVVDVAALYQAAKQAGLEMDFISAIQNDIKK